MPLSGARRLLPKPASATCRGIPCQPSIQTQNRCTVTHTHTLSPILCGLCLPSPLSLSLSLSLSTRTEEAGGPLPPAINGRVFVTPTVRRRPKWLGCTKVDGGGGKSVPPLLGESNLGRLLFLPSILPSGVSLSLSLGNPPSLRLSKLPKGLPFIVATITHAVPVISSYVRVQCLAKLPRRSSGSRLENIRRSATGICSADVTGFSPRKPTKAKARNSLEHPYQIPTLSAFLQSWLHAAKLQVKC